MQRRVVDIIGDSAHSSFSLGSVGLAPAFYDVFSGNVSLHETTYSPGESAMIAVQDACDAEFPSVAGPYVDSLGRLCCHGRYARFDPVGTSAATGWDFHDWKAGDHAAVVATPDMAQIRSFSISRDLGKIINHALSSPLTNLADPDFEGQVIQSVPSKELYGIRNWAAQDLIVKEGVTDGFLGGTHALRPAATAVPADTLYSCSTHSLVYKSNGTTWTTEPGTFRGADWKETKRYADYYIRNYQAPHNRVTEIGFRSMPKGVTWSQAATDTWALMSEIDINDRVAITLGSPGGGGFDGKQFFVEGVHEVYRPAGPELDDVTLNLDLSPADYFADSPFA